MCLLANAETSSLDAVPGSSILTQDPVRSMHGELTPRHAVTSAREVVASVQRSTAALSLWYLCGPNFGTFVSYTAPFFSMKSTHRMDCCGVRQGCQATAGDSKNNPKHLGHKQFVLRKGYTNPLFSNLLLCTSQSMIITATVSLTRN
jgi:hypothetical protein